MEKQTVQERYEQEQVMQGHKQTIQLQPSQSGTKGQLQKVFKQMEESLLQAHQSVRQAQLANPTQLSLQEAEKRLQYASQLLQQLGTSAPELTNGLTLGSQQQLTQLDHQIGQASGTLQLILKSISTG